LKKDTLRRDENVFLNMFLEGKEQAAGKGDRRKQYNAKRNAKQKKNIANGLTVNGDKRKGGR